MPGDNVRHFFVHRFHRGPNLVTMTALVLLCLFQRNTTISGESQRDVMSAGGFIRRVRHLALFHDGNAGSAAADIHYTGVVQLQQIRDCGWLIQHMAHFQPGRFQHVDGNTRVRTWRK